MANVKITALPSLTGAASDSLDVIPVVDVSADTTSKMTRAEFFSNIPAITGNVGIGVTPSRTLGTASVNNILAVSGSVTLPYTVTGAEPLRIGSFANTNFAQGTSSVGNAVGLTVSNWNEVGDGTTAIQAGIDAGSGGIELQARKSGAGVVSRLARFDIGKSQFFTNNTERMRIDASGNVGIGTASPNAASILDAQSTTKGVRFPNMTTTQKTAMANVAGNVVFDTTLGKLCVNSGSGWQTITSI